MHLLFKSTGCHSQTGASSSQQWMFAVSSTLLWSVFTRRGTRSCTLGAGPKMQSRCWIVAAAALTTDRHSFRTHRYMHSFLIFRCAQPYLQIECILTAFWLLLQYLFDITKEVDEVLISLQQKDLKIHRKVGQGENISIGFGVLKVIQDESIPKLMTF